MSTPDDGQSLVLDEQRRIASRHPKLFGILRRRKQLILSTVLLLTRLREQFDFIVLDSASLLGVTDRKVVSRLADNVLFAMQWHTTSLDTAVNTLVNMREARGAVAGVVLTQVDVREHAQYGYGDVGQYYGTYQKYYVN